MRWNGDTTSKNKLFLPTSFGCGCSQGISIYTYIYIYLSLLAVFKNHADLLFF